ncbi:hypothetical protein niasHT_033156 [Heterodera trifolii]|uniref:Uncharacterized protein n=1 Tax=Heterodera trifolii TaxID=157864 RepID=A0ABD2J3J1_9BILA
MNESFPYNDLYPSNQSFTSDFVLQSFTSIRVGFSRSPPSVAITFHCLLPPFAVPLFLSICCCKQLNAINRNCIWTKKTSPPAKCTNSRRQTKGRCIGYAPFLRVLLEKKIDGIVQVYKKIKDSPGEWGVLIQKTFTEMVLAKQFGEESA